MFCLFKEIFLEIRCLIIVMWFNDVVVNMDILGIFLVFMFFGFFEGIVIEDNLGFVGSGGGIGFDFVVFWEMVVFWVLRYVLVRFVVSVVIFCLVENKLFGEDGVEELYC